MNVVETTTGSGGKTVLAIVDNPETGDADKILIRGFMYGDGTHYPPNTAETKYENGVMQILHLGINTAFPLQAFHVKEYNAADYK